MAGKPTYEELEKKIQKLEQAESNLRHSEEQLIYSRHLMDYIISHARSAIAVFDRDLKYIYVSKQFLKEYKIKEENIIGKHHYKVFPDIPQKWKDVHQRSLAGEVLIAEEDPFYREDGSVDWTRWECRPWYEPNGSIGGIVIYNEVINERKKIEESLRESKNKLAIHLQNTPVGALFWDLNFKITEWNPAAEVIFGYSKAEAMGKHIPELILPEDMKELVGGVLQDLLSDKGGTHSTNENITKDGRRIICDWYNTALKDVKGKVIGVAALVQDVTERKRSEDALKDSEEHLRVIIEANKDAMIVINSKGSMTLFNAAAERMFGHRADDILGQPVNCLMPESLHAQHTKNVRDFFSTGKPDGVIGQTVEVQALRANGEQFPIEISLAAGGDNDRAFVVGVIRDFTERKKAEDEKKHLETQLYQAQKMESIGTLAGGIAHDFNNILFPILGHTEMLLTDIPEDSPFRDDMKAIYTSALRAKDLVKQILTFSRQDVNELQLMKIQPIVKESLKLIRSTIPATIEIKQDINADCGAIKTDPTQIHQIVMNLTTNAYHAMEEAGGELKVSLKQIKLETLDLMNPKMEPGAYACLIVVDTGVGMDKNVTDKIFDPFFTTKAIGKGTGMGLSVVHGIVTNMGGAVHVYSELGKGTEFHVYLPIEKKLLKKQATHSKTQIQVGTEQILIVDDEEAILRIEKQMLERLGYQVTSRTSSVEALEAFRANPDRFDVVITDMAMPNMAGDKLSAELTKIRSDIPILLCTGFSETMSEEKAASLGIKGFLFKPIVMKDLAGKIREVLDEN